MLPQPLDHPIQLHIPLQQLRQPSLFITETPCTLHPSADSAASCRFRPHSIPPGSINFRERFIDEGHSVGPLQQSLYRSL